MTILDETERAIKKLEHEYYRGQWAYSDYIRNRHELTMKIYELTAGNKAYCSKCGACKVQGCEHEKTNNDNS